MPNLGYLLADRLTGDSLELNCLVEIFTLEKTLKYFLFLILALYIVFFQLFTIMWNILQDSNNLVKMIFFFRID